ncbi:gas vesicle protein [Streptomyces sp. NPDC050619]|uniref:gas vesicle protein n=1 Tax=Streptomyces sp. NPDC050619 TaxID=3157214 RepID=UPI0034329A66
MTANSLAANSLAGRPVALIDLLDRLLQGGVVLSGDLVLSIADVDLVRIDLRAVIAPVAAAASAAVNTVHTVDTTDTTDAAHPTPLL